MISIERCSFFKFLNAKLNKRFYSINPENTQVWTFGDNSECQTGHLRIPFQKKPKPLHSLKSIVKISAGESHSICVDSQGHVFGFGTTEHGQLGLGIESPIPTPTRIPIDEKIIEVSSGKLHSLFLTEYGEIYSTGSGSSQQLGYRKEIQDKPRKIEAFKGVKIEKVISGWFHNFCLSDKGELFAWGLGRQGQLGLGGYDDILYPVILDFFNQYKIKLIGTGLFHTIVVLEDNRIFSFGSNKFGQCGIKYSGSPYLWKPTEISSSFLKPDENIIHLECGMNYTILSTDKGHTYAWGANELGTLGTKAESYQSEPCRIEALDGIILKYLCNGAFHSLAIDIDKKVYVWGQGSDYQLGNGEAEIYESPIVLPQDTFEGNDIISIKSGWGHTLAIINKNSVS